MRNNREKVLQEYLYRWQLEHNTALAEDGEAAETDAMVVLQDNWLSAQSALQAAASERHIESTRTVRLNPKSGAVDFDAPEVEETENRKMMMRKRLKRRFQTALKKNRPSMSISMY